MQSLKFQKKALTGLTTYCQAMPSPLPQKLSTGLLPSVHMVTAPGPGPTQASHLVPGVGCVHSLFVTAGFQEDPDGIQLQKHLTGHRVKEGNVGKGRRGQ